MTAEYLMALDVGDKRIGVALAHVIARMPRPLTTIENNDHVLTDIVKLIKDEKVAAVIVGLPRGMDGGYTEQTRSAERFKNSLVEVAGVPVYMGDETLTSVLAEKALQGKPYTKADIDAQAACIILDSFLRDHSQELPV